MLWTARAAQPVQTRRQQELAQQPVPPNVTWQLEQVEVRHPEELWRLHQSQMRDQLGRQELIERMVLFSCGWTSVPGRCVHSRSTGGPPGSIPRLPRVGWAGMGGVGAGEGGLVVLGVGGWSVG